MFGTYNLPIYLITRIARPDNIQYCLHDSYMYIHSQTIVSQIFLRIPRGAQPFDWHHHRLAES